MNRAQTRVQRQTKTIKPVSEFRTAVSLHSHTYHSKETLDFLPRYIDFHRIPVVSGLVRSELKRYEARNGKAVDFRRAYWTPPVTPKMVLSSETSQIEDKLGLAALVSITDHDTIAGPLSLQEQSAIGWVPVSVEWTIPFAGNAFHIGVHNLPSASAIEIMKELARYTAHPVEETLDDLFAFLDGPSETLLVLNHPGCNFVRVAPSRHWDSLREFLARHRKWIHALELNGMRPWCENQDVLRLSEEYDLPIAAGGDRHGCRPNTMLNLSQGETWSDFVAQIRIGRRNDILVLPAYEEPVPLRELATGADVLRRYPHHPFGQRRFTDRVFADVEGYSWHPLSFYWDGGNDMPKWLTPIVLTVVALGSDSVRPVLQKLFFVPGEYDRVTRPGKASYSSESMTAQTENPQ